MNVPGRVVRIRGKDVHYIEHNAEALGVPLLCIHGLDSSHLAWLNFIAALPRDRRTIAIDMPGFGYSSKPLDGVYTVEYMAQIVTDLLNILKIDRIILAGHSIGGAVCDYLSRFHPDRVAALVLIAGYRIARLGLADMNSKISKNILLFSYADKGNIDMDTALLQRSFYGGKALQDLKQRISVEMLNTVPQHVPEPHSDIPVLIVWGREDLILPLSLVGEGSLIDHKGAQLVVIDQAGHAVQDEQPARTAQALSQFCASHCL